MREATYLWHYPDTSEQPSEAFREAVAAYDLSEQAAQIVWQRGIHDPEALRLFFAPTLGDLHDPYLLHDLEKAVTRIQQAVETGEKIVVYGDYDADGMTSTTVMKEAIELLGGDVHYFLPNRFIEGYGPNQEAFAQLIADGCQLIVTVDNGVAGHEPLAYAKAQGIDVIVTDHHECPPELPDCYALIHPRHPAGSYPFGDLAGVGVAFKVACALLDEVPMELLDLVAIGTVADLVSLTGENRILVQMGLEVCRQTERLGLQQLASVAGVKLATMTEEQIGFGLAPRLNALGRLGDANPGVDLLSTFDEERAHHLAEMIQLKNEERQEIVQQITKEALAMIQSEPARDAYVLVKEGWHEGVLGIVASRIVQETNRPALVLSLQAETRTAKGSGRSIGAFNLYEALNQKRELFTHFGGHHMAAGMTFPLENLADIQEHLAHTAAAVVAEHGTLKETKNVDAVVQPADVTVAFVGELRKLAPFGTDQPVPQLALKEVSVKEAKRIGAGKDHLKGSFTGANGNGNLPFIGFGLGDVADDFATGDALTVYGTASINEWNGRKQAQLMLQDFSQEGLQLFDARGNKLQSAAGQAAELVAVSFQLKETKTQETRIGTLLLQPAAALKGQSLGTVLLWDCPTEAAELKDFIQATSIERLYLHGQSKEECYLNGLPTHQQFGQFYQFLSQQKTLDVRYRSQDIAQFLGIKVSLFIFMVQVFFDLKFVTIEDGVLSIPAHVAKRELSESAHYQAWKRKMKTEELLLFSDIQTIKQWLIN